MGNLMFVCPHGHYSIVSSQLVRVSNSAILIRCSVCQEQTIIPCNLPVTDAKSPERTDGTRQT